MTEHSVETQNLDLQKEHQQYIEGLGDWARTHSCGALDAGNLKDEVCLMGWVQFRRDHGGLIFVDLRDREGLTQVVFSPEVNTKAHERAHILRTEYVLAIRGYVRERPEGMLNPKMKTGAIEVVVGVRGLVLKQQRFMPKWLLAVLLVLAGVSMIDLLAA